MQLPGMTTGATFDEACTLVLDYLQQNIPMGFWSVTRHSGDAQLYLAVEDSVYGKVAGDSHPWSDSMCQFMLAGGGPEIAPDVEQVPAYAGAGVRDSLRIGAYVGLPLVTADGSTFGTLCGLDQSPQPVELEQHAPLLQLIAQLLSIILGADLLRSEAQRLAERSASEADTDALTGLYNRRGWEKLLAAEDARYRRFGHTGSIVILDLDNLKRVNDSSGHRAGDVYIQRAADTIRAATRAVDIVARLGGDEFGILAADTDSARAQVLVDRLTSRLTDAGTPGSIGHAPYTIISGFPGACEDADAAMYEQKRQRRAQADR